MMEQNEYPVWIALAHASGSSRGITVRRKNEIIVKCCHELGRPLSDLLRASKDELLHDFALTGQETEIIQSFRPDISKYAYMTEDLISQGYGLIPIFDKSLYPKVLKENMKYGAPPLLYYKGNVDILGKDAVAVVGSRNASEISLGFVDNVARKAVSQGRPTVSGYAKGVDQRSLVSTLKCGGQAVVVLPQGIQTFGSGFRTLYKDIVAGNVVVISTFSPSTPWSTGLAMARNAYIYGMGSDIYVAESGFKGGTIAGVEDGLRHGRRIFVRASGPSENNANQLLIQKGCVPVDMDGNEIIVPATGSSEGVPEEALQGNDCTGGKSTIETDVAVSKPVTRIRKNKYDDLSERVVGILREGDVSYTAGQIHQRIGSDVSLRKLTEIIREIPDVMASKKGRGTYYSLGAQRDLFSAETDSPQALPAEKNAL